jgi:peptide/nickel transport system permease protein
MKQNSAQIDAAGNVDFDDGELQTPVKKIGLARETWKSLKKNRLALVGLGLIILITFSVVFADFIAPYGIDDQDLLARFQSPSKEHFFGTDNFGRDIFSRVLYGGRVSLAIGLFSAIFSMFVGVLLGSIAGFYAGRFDSVIMRFIDVMMAIPSMLLAISIVAALGPGVTNVVIAVGIGMIPGYARIVRASIFSVKEQEYVEAARSIGANDLRIIARHILPNCLAPIIVNMTMSVARSILEAASLSFIGLGVQPPSPEWGAMLSAARPYIRDYWHVITFPGLAIMAIIFGLNLLGDGLRDALDPRLKR